MQKYKFYVLNFIIYNIFPRPRNKPNGFFPRNSLFKLTSSNYFVLFNFTNDIKLHFPHPFWMCNIVLFFRRRNARSTTITPLLLSLINHFSQHKSFMVCATCLLEIELLISKRSLKTVSLIGLLLRVYRKLQSNL